MTQMLKLVDVKQGGPPSPVASPHARHHTKNAEELRLQKGGQRVQPCGTVAWARPGLWGRPLSQ